MHGLPNLKKKKNYGNVFMVQFGPQGTRHFSCSARLLMCCAIHITSHEFTSEFSHMPQVYDSMELNRTDTMPSSYTVIKIRSAGAKFPPEYSDSNLIV